VKLVIFDCDGTLVDSQHVIVAAMAQAFEARGLPPPSAEATRSIIGLSMMEAITTLRPEADREEAQTLIENYRNVWLSVNKGPEPMFDGAEATIRSLAGRDDVLLGIATGKSQRGVRRLLEEKDLTRCFVTIQTADDAPSKPHPGMIRRALSETGAEADAAVMIGDTVFDIEMAVNADVHAIGVGWGYHPQEHLVEAGARRIVGHFSELEPALDALWNSDGTLRAG
jgi:phosphoglycolate phosphatase